VKSKAITAKDARNAKKNGLDLFLLASFACLAVQKFPNLP